jgi:hypothetical protein
MNFKIKPRKVKKNRRLKHGQMLLDVPKFAKAWNWREEDVREFVDKLLAAGMITVDGDVMTVVDFDGWISALNATDLYHPGQLGLPSGNGLVRLPPAGGVQ